MPIVRHGSTVAARDAGVRLDAFLADWLPARLEASLSRSDIRRLIVAGAVTVNGRQVRRPGLALPAGSRVEARVDLARLSASARAVGRAESPTGQTSTASLRIEILFRDPWLVAVAKPAGLLVHASADPRRPDLFATLRSVLGGERPDEAASPGAPYLGLHHRLDVDTSGVMLFTLDPAANGPLSRAFAEHRVEKVYHALVARPASPVPNRWIEDAPLALTGTGRRARMSAASRSGLEAETAFEVVRRLREALLIEARPRTGRKHQIRAHLTTRRLPILGDLRYGGASDVGGIRVPRVMLHACALRLSHPVTGVALDIRCPYPQDFREVLARLSAHVGRLTHPAASR